MKKLLPILAFVWACSGETPVSPTKPSDTTKVPPPKPTVSINPPVGAVPYNGMAPIGWVSTNTQSCSAPWTSNTGTSGQAQVRMQVSLWLTIRCQGLGGIVEDSVFITVLPRTLKVLIYVPSDDEDGFGLDTNSSLFTLTRSGKVDSLYVRGSASLPLDTQSPDTISFQLKGNAQYPLIVANIPKGVFDTWNDTLAIVRVPRNWVVTAGEYAGMTVSTDLSLAFKRHLDAQSSMSSFYSRQLQENGTFKYPLLGWDDALFPTKVWIDRDRSIQASGITPTSTDSTNLELRLLELNNLVGRRLFEYGGPGVGGSGILSYIDNFSIPGGAWLYNMNTFEAYGGVYNTTVSSRFTRKDETIHEIFHILGFGHTCSWVSYMQSGCTWTTGVGYLAPEKDVAHFELWQAINHIRRKVKARIHWGENLAGTQVERGLSVDRVSY